MGRVDRLPESLDSGDRIPVRAFFRGDGMPDSLATRFLFFFDGLRLGPASALLILTRGLQWTPSLSLEAVSDGEVVMYSSCMQNLAKSRANSLISRDSVHLVAACWEKFQRYRRLRGKSRTAIYDHPSLQGDIDLRCKTSVLLARRLDTAGDTRNQQSRVELPVTN